MRTASLAGALALCLAAGPAPALPVMLGEYPAQIRLSVSPVGVIASYNTSGVKTTNSATVTVTGGGGGIAHSWSFVSGSGGITATAPSSATTAFSRTVAACGSYDATWGDTVTSSGASPVTITIDVSFVSTC